MKNIISAIMIVAILGLASCIEESVGPMGPEGPQGPQGESGYVFEYDNIDFTAPDYEVFLPYPDDFESLVSDVALVYLLWDVVEVDGVDTEVWRQIPQNILTENGLLQYNFDFTTGDIRVFMNAEFDMSLLGALDTDDWVARVVIVPGEFWNSSRVAGQNIAYEELEELLGLPKLATPDNSIERRK